MSAQTRPYRPTDRDDVARVCLRTGAAGGDATGWYSDDTLVPDVAVLPYLEYAPDLALVVDDGERAAGYLVGVADTAAFIEWWRREWAPGFAARHPAPGAPTAHTPQISEALLVEVGGRPEVMRGIPELDAYPAQLHMNLLPELRGQGFGRRLVDEFRAALAARGVPALHLGIDPSNVGARAFYNRLGFHELPSSTPEHPLFGIATTP
ncbi:GNAT family N-acetyltransferase [Jiangella sp. DSM 45060]|uniref:GNAT family N-acetyltransferase n=1 Tax=Jiangella sp. DSM 45060 TaxID=1798224 RepID=UPI00087B7EC3|nr:GNAT family N-acetyltransferase [Jiangella sp. DSM 45060]SDS54137.1 Acetyltransferase (GNAT) family protein [Jiangella sp. DSM 45060]